jgi:hypothetical protein
MLPSTINTGSYVIEKYSRSNPSHVSAPTQSQGLTTGQPEWEHFAHPNMSLTLDVKKSMDNTYESVRLRIIWNNMNKGRDGTRGEVIMVRTTKAHICAFSTQRVLQEDLDLLSFSNLDSQGHSAHGPPLKAVYRGPVVGIRYLSPLTVPATSPNVRMTWLDLSCRNRLHADKQRVFTQSYCRFQANFAYVSDATQFINAIRPVCPCKEIAGGPPPPPIPVNKSLVPRSVFIQVPYVCACAPTSLPSHQRLAAAPTTRESNQYGRTQYSLPQQPRRALPEGVALPSPFELGSIPGSIIRSRTSDAPVRQVIPTVVCAARLGDAFHPIPIHGAQ